MSRLLQTARAKAAQADFPALLSLCQQLRTEPAITLEQLLDAGNLLAQFGFLSAAEGCYRQGLSLSPNDLRPWVNLANLERDRGDHASARAHYARVHKQLPDHPILRRNLLVGLEYDPAATDADRLNAARAWGDWAITRAVGPRARPALRPLRDRPLRLGYVSADLCQHTVGLLLKPVLAAHDPERVTVFAYSAGAVKDWVSRAIATSCRGTGGQCHEVNSLDDTALAKRIQADQIDLLIDLSGHTAGSRLSVFAQRPAPVQVSWLGYFATTGLCTIDAVLLDRWQAPEGT
jgi:tetratricopeptide (TPR) repeat protein